SRPPRTYATKASPPLMGSRELAKPEPCGGRGGANSASSGNTLRKPTQSASSTQRKYLALSSLISSIASSRSSGDMVPLLRGSRDLSGAHEAAGHARDR